LYTQELIQKTTAAATVTRGAKGAKTKPTVPMKSYISISDVVSIIPEVYFRKTCQIRAMMD
jgi:hypothetical protein